MTIPCNPSADEIKFFDFMARREALRLRKESGASWPWSDDPILNEFKFTNVKREHDRTTRWMRRHWTGPNEERPGGEILFNCALFRCFGKVEFAEAVGWQTDWNPDTVAAVAADRLARRLPVFTGAYKISNNGIKLPKQEVVCHHFLTPFWRRREALADEAERTKSWRQVSIAMRRIPGFGGKGFMTKEVLQDAMHTPVLRDVTDRNTYCPAGPGARRGLNRIHGRRVDQNLDEGRALHEMRALFQAAPNHLPDYMPELELHDIQFQLCEFDKYERFRLGQGRLKAKYRPPPQSQPGSQGPTDSYLQSSP